MSHAINHPLELTIDQIASEARDKRLTLDKKIKARKDEIRGELMFIEGDRNAPDADKPGIAALYRDLGCPCVPMATTMATRPLAPAMVPPRSDEMTAASPPSVAPP